MRRVFLHLSWWLTRPLLFLMSAERAHRLVLGTLGAWPRAHALVVRLLGGRPRRFEPIQVGNLTLAGPIGLAAGLDKDGEAIPFWPSLGFGFIEVGQNAFAAWDGGHPSFFHGGFGRSLVPHGVNHLRACADELDVVLGTNAREIRVL